MFEEPTLDDFLERIDWHLSEALNRAAREVTKVRGEFAVSGGFQSGRRAIFSVEAVRPEFAAGITAALGELK